MRVFKLFYFEWSPPWHLSVIVSDISPGNIWHSIWHSILGILSDILFLAFYLASILASFVAPILTFSLAFFLLYVLDSGKSSGMLSVAFYLTFYSGVPPGIYSHSFLAFYLVYLQRFFVVEVWRGTLWRGACGGGPAGNTLIRSLLSGSGGENFDLALAVEVWTLGLQLKSGGEHSDPELAVRVRRKTLRSSACSWGPAEEAGRRRRRDSGHKI